MSASDLCRMHGISDTTFYKRRSRYGRLEISDARKLKGLEDENRKLKKSGRSVRELFAAASSRAGRAGSEDLSLCLKPAGALRTRLKELASQRRRFGHWRLGLLLARQGVQINHKLYRLSKKERLSVRKRGGRKRARGTRAPMAILQDQNLRWSLDFVMDTLVSGRRVRILTLVGLHAGMPDPGRRYLAHKPACRARTRPCQSRSPISVAPGRRPHLLSLKSHVVQDRDVAAVGRRIVFVGQPASSAVRFQRTGLD
jgi:hypothetical protein